MTQTITKRTVATMAAAASIIAISAPVAGAATTAPAVFSGSAEALALDLKVSAAPELLGGITDILGEQAGQLTRLTQKVSLTSASLNSEGVAEAAASLLSDGLFDTGTYGTGTGNASGQQGYGERVLDVVEIGAGTVEYLADAAGNHSRSFSELAHLNLTIAPLFTETSPLPAELQAPVQDAVAVATDTVNLLVGELNGILDQVEVIVEDTVGQVIAIPTVLPDELPQVPDVTMVDLIQIKKIWSLSEVLTTGEKVRSTATSGIVEASLLGGLVEVPAFQYTSWAETAGTPGSANAGTDITTIAVRLADDTVVSVVGNVLTVGDFALDLDDPNLAGLPAGDILGPVTDILGQVLDAAGLSIAQGVGTVDIAADGSYATANTSAFALRLTPLNAAGQADLLDIQLNLLPSAVAASAGVREAGNPAVTCTTNCLPQTGGGSIVAGLAALGGAGFLRRRKG